MLFPGTSKLGWLNRSKNSPRNSALNRSPIGNSLTMEKSVLNNPGARTMLRPSFPYPLPEGPPSGASCWKQEALNHWATECGPLLGLQVTSGRSAYSPVNDVSELSIP